MIKMLTPVSGEKDGKGFSYSGGEETDVFSDAEEARFVERDLAEYVNKATKKKVSKKAK